MQSKLKEKRLRDGDKVAFVGMHKTYGRAEFVVCSKYVRGKLSKLYITPAQQPDMLYKYFIDVKKGTLDWSMRAWTHKSIDTPYIWIHFWCTDHQCPAMRLYVPAKATHFAVSELSNLSLDFSV